MKRFLSISALGLTLAACGNGTPFTPANTVAPGDPNTDVNKRYLFDTTRKLTANQFTYDAAANTIVINNLPFDGVSSSGGAYTPRPGVVLPNGALLYQNSPGAGEDQYYAVVYVSPDGTGALVGAVGTNAYVDYGYGGAYAERPSSGLPASRAAAYSYTGNYTGVRVLRQETTGAANSLQVTTGVTNLTVDLQNLDSGGSIKGRISGRKIYDVNGTLLGTMSDIYLNQTGIDRTQNRTQAATATTYNTTTSTTQAQTGKWEGSFSGPAGAEVVGYVLIEGPVSDTDTNYDATNAVNGREVGGFIAKQNP